YGAGGVLETVVPPGDAEPPTGLYFERQTVEGVIDGIRRFEDDPGRFEPKLLRRRAEAFDRPLFKERVERYLLERVALRGRCCRRTRISSSSSCWPATSCWWPARGSSPTRCSSTRSPRRSVARCRDCRRT